MPQDHVPDWGFGENVYATRVKEPGRWIWYLLFISMPLYEAFVLHVRPYEVVAFVALFFIVFGRSSRNTGGIRTLDVIVMLYAGFQILVVAAGSHEFYDSARYYRYLVLGPALVYAVIRLLPFSPQVLLRANFLLAMVIAAQAVYLVWIYTVTGARAAGSAHMLVPSVNTYSLYAAYALALLVFARRLVQSRFGKLVWMVGLILLSVGLVVGSSRAATFPILLLIPAVYFIWRSRFRRKILAYTIIGGLIALVLSLAIAPPVIEFDKDKLAAGEDRAAAQRLLSWDDYLSDGATRIRFWAYMFDRALETPLLGYGYAGYDIGDTKLGGHVSSAHNILISNAVTGGMISLMLMLGMMFAGAIIMTRFSGEPGPLEFQGKILLAMYPIMLIAALTGDLTGGKAVLFFFLLGLIQQTAIHGKSDHGRSPVTERKSQLSIRG